jgi:hypothetical protein
MPIFFKKLKGRGDKSMEGVFNTLRKPSSSLREWLH